MNILDHAFARFYDNLAGPMERRGLADRRAQLLGALEGEVLEIGAGTGANLAAYPDGVTLTVTEPSAPMAVRLREHVGRDRPDTRVVEAPAEKLPFADGSFDAAVSTLVLCTVHDPLAAIAELRRVLRPGGRLVVIEHVVAKGRGRYAQRVWEPAQKVLARNCHVTRDTRQYLETSGFDTSGVVDIAMPGAPAAVFPAISGIAIAPAA